MTAAAARALRARLARHPAPGVVDPPDAAGRAAQRLRSRAVGHRHRLVVRAALGVCADRAGGDRGRVCHRVCWRNKGGMMAPVTSCQTPHCAASLAVAIAIPAEGLRQWAYYDPPGILTVCYGSTTNVQKGVKYSLDECGLDDDMRAAIAQVGRLRAGACTRRCRRRLAMRFYNIGPRIAGDTSASTAARLLKVRRGAAASNAEVETAPRWRAGRLNCWS